MPQQLKYVAQFAMDSFYQAYKGADDFWDIEDFIIAVGNTVSGMYLTYYQQQYAMLRQEKKDELVSFDAGWLIEQEVEVKQDGKKLSATLDLPIMTFPYDQSSIGIQNVFNSDTDEELERTSLSTLWQLKYIPYLNRVFFYSSVSSQDCDIQGLGKVNFVSKGDCNIKKALVQYVPSMNEDAFVPDGLIGDAISKTVLTMKQVAEGVVVDTTANMNGNKIIQSEIDKNTLGK